MDIKAAIRTVPDWPVKGVMFRDITTLLQNPAAFKETIDRFYDRYKDMNIDKIVGIDARGLIFGAPLAYKMEVGFIPVRKKGKLPYKTTGASYALEYGESAVEIHEDAIENGERVLIIDDLIATGGTIEAAIKLVEKLGGEVVECAFVIDLPDLKGKEKIKGYNIFALMEFEGE
ncbi:MAG: adenine phosphoribosyltransferase [Thermodesulfobacteriota bacterium]|nr:adenine phosphoribosyltransferase [Thermodesulfobacteriota bacterium]